MVPFRVKIATFAFSPHISLPFVSPEDLIYTNVRVPHTCGPSPPRDAAGVVGLKELGGPGDTHGADGRVVQQTFVRERKLLQLHQSDVVLISAGVVPSGQNTLFHTLYHHSVTCMCNDWGLSLRWINTLGGCECLQQVQCQSCPDFETSSREKTSHWTQTGWAWPRERELLQLPLLLLLVLQWLLMYNTCHHYYYYKNCTGLNRRRYFVL